MSQRRITICFENGYKIDVRTNEKEKQGEKHND